MPYSAPRSGSGAGLIEREQAGEDLIIGHLPGAPILCPAIGIGHGGIERGMGMIKPGGPGIIEIGVRALDEVGHMVRRVAAISQALGEPGKFGCGLFGQPLARLGGLEMIGIGKGALQPLTRIAINQVFKAELVDFLNGVGPVGMERMRSISDTMSSGGFSSATEYCSNCAKAFSRSFFGPLYSHAKQPLRHTSAQPSPPPVLLAPFQR